MNMVSESVVIQDRDKLIGLVYPDYDDAKQQGYSKEKLSEIMEENRKLLNETLPAYCRISSIELRDEEFAKTPKRSIRRYLYMR